MNEKEIYNATMELTESIKRYYKRFSFAHSAGVHASLELPRDLFVLIYNAVLSNMQLSYYDNNESVSGFLFNGVMFKSEIKMNRVRSENGGDFCTCGNPSSIVLTSIPPKCHDCRKPLHRRLDK